MALERVSNFPNEGEVTVLPGDPQEGDVVRTVGTQDYRRHYADVPAMDHAVAQLMTVNSSTQKDALGRFTAVMEAAKNSTDAAVRFAYARYEAADIFEKTNTDTLTSFMVSDTTSGHLEANERTAVLDNWPTG